MKRPVTTVVSNNESSAASRRRSSSRNANSSSTRVKSSGRNATFKQPTDNEIKFKTQSHLDDEEHQQQLADVENSNKLEDEITAMITMMNVNTDKNDNPDVKSDGAGSLSDIDQNDDIMNDEKWDTDIEKEGKLFQLKNFLSQKYLFPRLYFSTFSIIFRLNDSRFLFLS